MDNSAMFNSRGEMQVYYDELVSMDPTEDDSSDCSRSQHDDDDEDDGHEVESNNDEYKEKGVDDDGVVAILGELVGARNLSFHAHDDDTQNEYDYMNDSSSKNMRPYCIIKFGDRIIHRSKRAKDSGTNPIWTISTRSLFLIKASPKQISKSTLNISLYTRPDETSIVPVRLSVGSERRKFLGQVNLNPNEILENCNDKRFEVNVMDAIGDEETTSPAHLGTLALRFRLATRSDQKIMKTFCGGLSLSKSAKSQKEFAHAVMLENKSLPSSGGDDDDDGNQLFDGNKALATSKRRPLATLVTETAETEIASTTVLNALSSIFTSRVVRDRETGDNKFRIKPYPDPARPRETQFMSKQEILVATRQPSTKWVEAGSGTLGKLYVEVLSCHDLPNVDVGEAVGNVTDSFITLVYEDTCAMTEVIDDELSPHWLPWTQRAFCFGMMHPASLLYLGVFDYDLGPGGHEAIGRVAVNVANLQRNTVYTLKYNLYPSANITDRVANGTITIRLRVECFDEKAALLAALRPRPKMHVNVTKEKSFKVIRYTCFGEYDNEEKFDMTVTRSYINEIFEYKAALGYVLGDTVRSLMFWRGQVEFCTIKLPIHSFLFFCMSTDLVECPYKVVPYTLLGVAWVMIANLQIQRQHPSPWTSPPSFWQFLHLLRTGKSSTPIETIAEYEGHEAAVAYEKAWQKRLEQDQMLAERRAQLQLQIDNIGDDNISTKVKANNAIPLDLLNRLARYQKMVGGYCGKFRFIKIILTWEESVISFWITVVFLGAGFVSLILPWNFILLWTGRLFVYGCFGPHMKLVDIYLSSTKKSDASIRELRENFNVQSRIARLRREEAVKQKDMKEIAFGKYSVRIPKYNLARHYDRPLPASCARICRQNPIRLKKSERRLSVAKMNVTTPWIPGQQLFGTMIPRPEHEAPLFKAESLQLEKRLEALKDRVESIQSGGGSSSILRLKHRGRHGKRKEHRVSFGHELVHPGNHDKNCVANDLNAFLTSQIEEEEEDDHDLFIGSSHSIEVVLGNDGEVSVFDDADDYVEDDDEEGLEVLGLGRYSTIIDESSSRELLAIESCESIIQDNEHSRLSRQYSSSRNVAIAFYRPLAAPGEHRLKQD